MSKIVLKLPDGQSVEFASKADFVAWNKSTRDALKAEGTSINAQKTAEKAVIQATKTDLTNRIVVLQNAKKTVTAAGAVIMGHKSASKYSIEAVNAGMKILQAMNAESIECIKVGNRSTYRFATEGSAIAYIDRKED
jgi:hypothetical protein